MNDDNIKILSITNKRDGEQKFLVPVPYSDCQHAYGPFQIDDKAGKCKCMKCGGEVSPMFVLTRLMQQESLWMQRHRQYDDEMKRLSERTKTKCKHCGKMTHISRS